MRRSIAGGVQTSKYGTLYSHFAQNFGFVENLPDNALVDKYIYKNHSIKGTEGSFKITENVVEIKYVSCLVRNKLKVNPNSTDESFNHDKYIEHNFWRYVKKVINYKEAILPTFNMNKTPAQALTPPARQE